MKRWHVKDVSPLAQGFKFADQGTKWEAFIRPEPSALTVRPASMMGNYETAIIEGWFDHEPELPVEIGVRYLQQPGAA